MPTGAAGVPGYQGTGGLGYIPEGQERRYIAGPDDYLHGFLPEWMFFENLNPPAVIDTNYPVNFPVDGRGGGGIDDQIDETSATSKSTGGLVIRRQQGKMITPGNIDVENLPTVLNPNGTVSTIRSMSINIDGKEVLIPTVINGRVVSEEEAIQSYLKTGKHLGIFSSPEAATAYGKSLSAQQDQRVKKATGGLLMTKPKVFSPRDYLEMVRGYNMGGVAELPVGEQDAARNLMTDGNKDLIDLTRAVILGEVDERADEIIQKFIDLYGYEEFQALRDETLEQMAPRSMKSGLIRGQTGGMDDMVDGVIGSRERVAVSPGEFIVPADVVAALGDGNTEKGGKELEKMMERTRMQKYGSRKQPPPVNLDNVMPA